MQNSKRLWRTFLFLALIAALCGNFAFPVLVIAVKAAPQLQVPSNVVISEFRTRGPSGGTDEFVEIYNPTTTPINIGGWFIKASNNVGTIGNRYTFPAGTVLQAGQHFIVTGTTYSGGVQENPVAALSGTGITDDGGIALVSSDNTTIIDQVGMSNGSAYGEGTRLAALTTNVDRSYERNMDISGSCVDTNSNVPDFFELNPSDPQNSSSPIATCGNPTPTPTSTPTATDTPTPTNTPTSTDTPTATSTGIATSTPTSTPTGTATSTPTGTNTLPGNATNVVISEFRTSGPNGGNDEFIEIYNPLSVAIDISNWKINASNDSGSVATRATIPAATLLRSGQYYLIANNSSSGGYSNTNVAADLAYSTGVVDKGGIALLKPDNTIVDRVGMSSGSAYKEGTPLDPLSGTTDQSYERRVGGSKDSCQDSNDNAKDFFKHSSDPHNYFSALSLCGTLVTTSPVATTITITGHTPNPSRVNAGVLVSVKVTVPFSSSVPTGTVNITGANTNCSITLTSGMAGNGSCTVYFSSLGTKTLTAIYVGDNSHLKSISPTVSHQVTTTGVSVPTAVPTPKPPPELVVINEFVPRPGHDWNQDGVVNVSDEYIELLNHGTVNVSLSGWSLDDEVNIGSSPFRLPAVTIRPGERIVFYGNQTGLLLGDGGDGVRLLKSNGQLMDAYNYTIVGYPDQAFCRLPDNGGADDWSTNCFPTPGLQNSLSGEVQIPVQISSDNLYCPIADTQPDAFAQAECRPFGSNIWRPEFWDRTGWYGEMPLPGIDGKWPVFAN